MAKSYGGFLGDVSFLLERLIELIMGIVRLMLKVIVTVVKIVVGCYVIVGLGIGVVWLFFSWSPALRA